MCTSYSCEVTNEICYQGSIEINLSVSVLTIKGKIVYIPKPHPRWEPINGIVFRPWKRNLKQISIVIESCPYHTSQASYFVLHYSGYLHFLLVLVVNMSKMTYLTRPQIQLRLLLLKFIYLFLVPNSYIKNEKL